MTTGRTCSPLHPQFVMLCKQPHGYYISSRLGDSQLLFSAMSDTIVYAHSQLCPTPVFMQIGCVGSLSYLVPNVKLIQNLMLSFCFWLINERTFLGNRRGYFLLFCYFSFVWGKLVVYTLFEPYCVVV